MNQPASKEPTMDEILSSIRQIIADDDDAASQKAPPTAAKPAAAPVAEPVAAASAPEPESAPAPVDPAPAPAPSQGEALIDPFSDDGDDDGATPLALSPDQIVAEDAGGDAAEDALMPPETDMPSADSLAAAEGLVVPDDVAFDQDEDSAPASEPAPEPEPAKAQVSEAAPMPDKDLSSDLADQLLGPATEAAVRSAFTKLDTPKLSPDMPLGASGLTIESMIREMLRPMLKEWLEENLPSMVERIVAQEIERVSRGGQ